MYTTFGCAIFSGYGDIRASYIQSNPGIKNSRLKKLFYGFERTSFLQRMGHSMWRPACEIFPSPSNYLWEEDEGNRIIFVFFVPFHRYLSNNELNGTIPPSFAGLTNLRFLWVQRKYFSWLWERRARDAHSNYFEWSVCVTLDDKSQVYGGFNWNGGTGCWWY